MKKAKVDVKIVLIGKQGIGKSALLERFKKDVFNHQIENTIGAAFATLERLSADGTNTIRVNIWDTAGMERFKSLVPMYMRDATIVFICFDTPYVEEVQKQIEFVRNTNEECAIVLVQTKIDLSSSYESRDIISFAKEYGYKIYRTSSKSGAGVHMLFDENIERAYLKKMAAMKSVAETSSTVTITAPEPAIESQFSRYSFRGCCILM